MTFRPKLKGKKEIVLSLSMALLAVIMFALSGIVSKLVIIYQVSAIIFAVAGIELYMKYVGSDYIYEAADDSLKIYKVTGKKSICVCSLDYEMSLSYVVTDKEFTENKKNYPSYNFNVNLAKNLTPSSYYVYFFKFNDKTSMLKFEPDEVFVEYLNNKISQALENTEENGVE